MKLLYATDPHLKGKNPARRKDHYPSEILMLFDELREVAKKEKVAAVLIGGDVLDTPKISQKLFNKLSRTLKRFPCPIYVVPGNHDVYGQNADTLEDTQLGNLEASGVVTLVTRDVGSISIRENGCTIALYGQEYTDSLDEGNPADYDITPDPFADWHILMTHSMLTEKPFVTKHTLVKDVHSRADIILGAHYHPGFDIIEMNNVIFCAPGAMARLEGTITEATRTVQYAIIEADKDDISVNLYPFKNARPGKDILDLQAGAEQKQHKSTLEVFRQTVDDASQHEQIDLFKILGELYHTQGIPLSVMTEAQVKLQEAEKTVDDLNQGLSTFSETVGTGPVVRWIRLKNFQSHEDTYIEFTDGLNALTGASDSGKTAIIRAIRWLLYNEPKGTDFIRHGASEVMVQMCFDHGDAFANPFVIERRRTQSASGHYKVYTLEPDGSLVENSTYTGFGNNIPVDIKDVHQMPKSNIAKDLEVSLNMSYQLDGPFMLGESNSTRAAIIGSLTGVQVADAAIQATSKIVVNLQRDIKSEQQKLQDLSNKLTTEFADVPVLESEVNNLELLIAHGESLETKKEQLVSIRDQYTQAKSDIKKAASGLVSIAQKHKALTEAIPKLEDLIRVKRNMENTKKDIQAAQQQIDTATAQLDNFKDVSKAMSMIVEIQDKVAHLQALKSIRANIQSQETSIGLCEAGLADLPTLDMAKIKEIEDKISYYKALKRIKGNLFASKNQEETMENKLKANQRIIETLQKSYRDILTEAGRCPVCSTPIDDTIIDKIAL